MKRKQTATSGMEWNTMLGLTQRLKQDKQYRDYLMITVGCYFGLRIGDLLSLRWSDVIDKDELILTEQKTKKSRKITINPKVSEAINLCLNKLRSDGTFSETGYLFSNRWGGPVTISYVNKRLKVVFKKYNVNVKNPSSHTLRKTFGKRIYESDNKSEKALIYLSEIFSHSSISTTRRYIGITQEHIADMYLAL
ncbi:MAG: tyrosine-type recombinase/integrase [Bacteroidetes bacterium]|nr:tyrosine-type recombinase/integrase [Bacteroidota bacterium]